MKRLFFLGLLISSSWSLAQDKNHIKKVRCFYKNLLTDDTVDHTAVKPNKDYLLISGKVENNIFVSEENKRLVSEFCSYTNRVYHQDDSVLYQPTSIKVDSNEPMEIIFESLVPYPEGLDSNWFNTIKPHSPSKSMNWNKMAVKGVTTLLATLGGAYFVCTADKETATRLIAMAGIVPFAWSVSDFIFEQEFKSSDAKALTAKGKSFLTDFRTISSTL